MLEGSAPKGNNERERLCDSIGKGSLRFAVIWKAFLSYKKNNYVISMDFLAFKAF